MKTIVLILTFFSTTLITYSQTDSSKLGYEYARQELESVLNNESAKQILVDTVIKSQVTAINYAEIILFDVYGQKNIEKQKPYEVYKIDGYWIIGGKLPKGMLGGTFKIIFNSKNGQIIKLTHGK